MDIIYDYNVNSSPGGAEEPALYIGLPKGLASIREASLIYI